MPRSVEEILAQADALADHFESDNFDGVSMTPEEYELHSAARARADAEARVVSAVRLARSRGLSWAKVGHLVGTSGEAARQRYAGHAAD